MARKEKKYHFIYKTTNLLNGKYYIGMHSTDNLEDGYLGSGKRLRYSINKHGTENHVREILEFVNSREDLKKREKEIISTNEIAKKECLNLKVGGDGGFSNEAHKIKFIKSGINNFEKTKHKREKTLELKRKDLEWEKNRLIKVRKGLCNYYKDNEYHFKNKRHSEETKKIMSEKKKGKFCNELNSQHGTCWITKDGVNKKIKKEELENFIFLGWNRGRVV